jgi:cell division protein FtsB
MKRLIEQRYLIRRNILAIAGIILTFYFSYHAGFGDRSLLRLVTLQHDTGKLTTEYDQLHAERLTLESRVARLRPGNLDRDLLEERARYVLGFVRPGETLIIQQN